MSRLFKELVFNTIFTFAGFSMFIGGAHAGNPVSITNDDPADLSAYTESELESELKNTEPLPLLEVEMPQDGLATIQFESLSSDAEPGYAPGWNPDSGLPMPNPTTGYTITKGTSLYEMASGGADFTVFGTAPTNPLNGPYGPFQRWTWYGRYLSYPTSTIGKLFFDTTDNGVRNASCSATVISNRTIVTAAHCLRSQGGTWYDDWLFCPSYNAGGINPTRGCWDWSTAVISSGWVTSGQIDRDYACIVTAPTGTVVSNTVGSQTGALGRAWNWASEQMEFSWGYPGQSPFPGYHIIANAAPEWYEVNITIGDGQVSKYMGNDMTRGSSGGSWWLNIAHRSAEWPAVDSDSSTDPNQGAGVSYPWVNGLNSHKRCKSSCYTPPTSGSGTYWTEMGGPQFRNTAGDSDETEDVFATCFGNE